jgi:capsule polysaccharide export protein KpsE/RkpR
LQQVDLRVARNAERRAKEVLSLKQAELNEAEGKLSTYARMYGHTSMERMAHLSARVAELEEALAEARTQVRTLPAFFCRYLWCQVRCAVLGLACHAYMDASTLSD